MTVFIQFNCDSNLAENGSNFAQEKNDFIIHPCNLINSDNTDITKNSDMVQTIVLFDSDSNIAKKIVISLLHKKTLNSILIAI